MSEEAKAKLCLPQSTSYHPAHRRFGEAGRGAGCGHGSAAGWGRRPTKPYALRSPQRSMGS